MRTFVQSLNSNHRLTGMPPPSQPTYLILLSTRLQQNCDNPTVNSPSTSHPLTHSLIHPLTHSLIHSLTHFAQCVRYDETFSPHYLQPWVHPNGTLYVACGREVKGNTINLWRANNISGPWELVTALTHWPGGPRGKYEDPFVYT